MSRRRKFVLVLSCCRISTVTQDDSVVEESWQTVSSCSYVLQAHKHDEARWFSRGGIVGHTFFVFVCLARTPAHADSRAVQTTATECDPLSGAKSTLGSVRPDAKSLNMSF